MDVENTDNSRGARVRAGLRRIEAALTRQAIGQPDRKARELAQRIGERSRDWEAREIAKAEAQAAALRAARRSGSGVLAENVPDGTAGLETA